uniref:Proteasome 26S subunit, non-ATPase 10 n=1 Tax=Anser cygnoides TaxID=8845 RepID=A0A8B9EMP1_ANSCY
VSVSEVAVCNMAYGGRLDELRAQLQRDRGLATAADQAGRTALHWACSAGHAAVADLLLGLGVPVSEKDDAASKNKQEIAIMLLENGADPDATDHFESTPLHRAAAKGNLKMIQILLRHKASVNIQDSEGNTPLHLACDEERVDEAKLLVSHGASIHIENKEELTPLKVAKGGLGAILKRMVEG